MFIFFGCVYRKYIRKSKSFLIGNSSNWLVLLLSFFISFSQAIGQDTNNYYPFIKNYQRSDYLAGMQTWMMSQASNNLMYFANDHGLLEFDGNHWNKYALAGQALYRAVLATDDGKIHVGATDNFGYFELDSSGHMIGHSLLDLLPPAERNIGQIWKIHETNDGIVFQSYEQLIVVKDNEVKLFKAPTKFRFSFLVNEKLYVVDRKQGVFEFKNGELLPLKGTNFLSGMEVRAILPFDEDLLIITMDDGAFVYNGKSLKSWDTPASSFIKKNQAYCALRVDKDHIAFGTIQKGLFICTNDGVQTLAMDKTHGLQKNTVLCMNLDDNGNLWLGTDNGIDLVFINESLSQLDQNQELSSGYAAALHNGYLYLGTNQGVFYKKWNTSISNVSTQEDFKLIQNTKGQVWKLEVIDDVLFCGHNSGTYLIEGTIAEKISTVSGGWIYLQSAKDPNKIIAGSYSGLLLFERIDGKWRFSKKIEGFSESSRIMVFDEDESIWMSHGFKGLYHIQLNQELDSISNVDFFNTDHGFYTAYGISVTKIQDQIVFLSPHGAFQIDDTGKKVIASDHFNDFFSNAIVNEAFEDEVGNIWYFSDRNINVKQIQRDGSYYDVSLPFKPLHEKFIEGFQFVSAIDADHTLIGYEDGFIHYNPNHKKDYQKPLEVFINQAKILETDSVLFQGHLFSNEELITELEYEDNKLHFSFSAINFEIPEKLHFSTFLEGYEKEWSKWESKGYREFTNLQEGEYSFQVKAKNEYGIESQTIVYHFSIKPPWSRTDLAYSIYSILFLLSIALTIYLVRLRISYLRSKEIKIQQRKYETRASDAQKTALISEKEIIRLRNDRLREKIKTKDKELANSTMQIIQKNEFLIGLKEFVSKNNSTLNGDSTKNGIKRVVRKIDNELNSEKAWKVFETHFGNVHEEFLSILKKEHPQISPAELRMSACLRMNISSKEIATLLNISLRGVEASRYRLRKSLDLDRENNLTDFILSM